jgi:hypothetical protein
MSVKVSFFPGLARLEYVFRSVSMVNGRVPGVRIRSLSLAPLYLTLYLASLLGFYMVRLIFLVVGDHPPTYL